MQHIAVDWGDRCWGSRKHSKFGASQVMPEGFMDVVFFTNLDRNSINTLQELVGQWFH